MTTAPSHVISSGSRCTYINLPHRSEAALLFVHHAQRRRPPNRENQRAFQQAVLRVESTAVYRQSLRKLLELDRRFERTLTPAQRPAWLDLEEALLEHASRLYQSYFESGVELGESRRSSGLASRESAERLRPQDIEVAAALARVLARLTRRRRHGAE